jgi:hypothetical protein
MEGQISRSDLKNAETKLSQALERLSALRQAAAQGQYSPVEFDNAIRAYRFAEEQVRLARLACAAGVPGSATRPSGPSNPRASPGPNGAGMEPLQPSPRMLFAKWLVETGRLSDWDG